MKDSESQVLKIEESESESELLCTDCTALPATQAPHTHGVTAQRAALANQASLTHARIIPYGRQFPS
jgi:hypothetical protein